MAVYQVLDGNESNPRIKLFENFGAAVQALMAGDVDMVLMDAASGRGYVGANPDKLKVIGDPLGTEEFGFIFTPGSDLVAPFNAAIAQMKADGFLAYLNTRWFYMYDPSASAAPSPAATEAAAPGVVTATEVIKFVPQAVPAGETKKGSCWTNSLAASGREDAWRCNVGDNMIEDPCFALPNDATMVVCGFDPTTNSAGYGLKLTQPLPKPDVPQDVVDAYKSNGWLVLLADGSYCGFMTGATFALGNDRGNYGCTGGEWYIMGDLQPGTVWKAKMATITMGDNGAVLKDSKTADVLTVWQ